MTKSINFLRWAGSSLVGHVVIYGLAGMIVLSSVALYLNYSEGTLTFTWGLYTIVVCTIAGVVVGVIGWYSITLPMIKRRDGKF
jgi:hypothetical protein